MYWRTMEIGTPPHLDVGPFLAQQTAGDALEAVHEVGDGDLGRVLHQQVDMIILAVHLDQLRLEVGADPGEDRPQRAS